MTNELIGIISNEGELKGVIEDDEFNVIVQITESGPRGLPGKDGYTPIKGIDYFDGVDGKDGEQGIQGEKGIQGEQGEQGEQGIQGIQGERGEDGSDFTILGYYATIGALETAVPNQNAGNAYGVGNEAPYDIYIWE